MTDLPIPQVRSATYSTARSEPAAKGRGSGHAMPGRLDYAQRAGIEATQSADRLDVLLTRPA